MSEFLHDVSLAAKSLRELFVETPLQLNHFLSKKYGAEIYLKREDLTPVRSYKIRGAFNFVSKMLHERPQDSVFVCASAGNHAQGLAFVCNYFKCKGVIFMPVTTPQQKIDKTRIFGGDAIEIKLIGDTFDECYAAAQTYVAEVGGVMAPPFDHYEIVKGQATVMHEIAEQWQKLLNDDQTGMDKNTVPDMVIVPVGGGGLASGTKLFLQEKGWQTQLRFSEPENAASLRACLEQKKRLKLDDIDNFVDGAAVAEIGAINYDILKSFSPFDVSVIPENRLCATMIEMLNVEGIVLEPAGGLAIDALKSLSPQDIKGKKIVLIVSGGNFDFERLPDVKERALRYEGLKKYFIFRFPQRPGALRRFLDQLGPDDDVARFEYLKKSARNFGSVLIAIETKNYENFAVLAKKFDDSGWAYRDITNDKVLADFVI
ncbi:threonine ammonia-lyase IlvA [Bartonella tamiae]|uniref:L-threonine dehydratase n=1 Tax=Bartonella tamiae Th239 TaxID=1094558 RepID=J0ZKX0_9HYPH|nr:threonine ammonia-lyase IlvA [Bartonella tamiae]EJF89013.1 threonine dehydratase [Bartonella tamiae Th239]EJF94737.1 threonine dehydratase [Bartonella tamiae Th307]